MRTATRGDGIISLTPSETLEPIEPNTQADSVVSELASSIMHPAIHKILQSKQSFGLLVCHPEQGYIQIRGHTVNPLQAMQRGTGEVLMQCAMASSGVSEMAGQFQICTRVACTDRNSANARAEEMVLDARGPAWNSMQCHCEVHKTANTLTRTLDHIIPDQIRGMLHTSLSLRRYASGMPQFRAALKAEINARLQILEGATPAEALAYRERCIDLFVSGSGSLARSVLLLRLPNGDWTDPQLSSILCAARWTHSRQNSDMQAVAIRLIMGVGSSPS